MSDVPGEPDASSIHSLRRRLSSRVGEPIEIVVKHAIVWAAQAFVLSFVAGIAIGVEIDGFWSAVVVIVVVAALNALLMPVLLRVAARLSPILFPLLSFLLNGLALFSLQFVMPGWQVDGVISGGIISGVMAMVATTLGSLLSLSDDQWWHRYSLNPLRARYAGMAPATDTPGFAFLEIDGLSEAALREAMEHGYVPNLESWLTQGTHTLTGWECDLSSQTSASQAGILLGNNTDVPAFRWYDKDVGKVLVSSSIRDSGYLEQRLTSARGLLVDDGASRGNLFSGDAPDSLFTIATITNPERRSSNRQYMLFYANFYNVARIGALFVSDVIREVVAAVWQRVRNERPRVRRFGVYPLIRAATTSILRELSTFSVAGDLIRGVPSVYATYFGYDEVAHHSGLLRGDALRVLREIDRDIGRLAKVASAAPRPYHLVVLSDHGQSQGETFRQRYGETLAELVDSAVAVGDEHPVQWDPGSDEGWYSVSALLSDVLARDERLGPIVRRAFRRRIHDGEVWLGPEEPGHGDAPLQKRTVPEPGDVVVLASGNLGLVSFTAWPHRATLEEIERQYPYLVANLIEHPGVGFVLVRTEDRGPVVFGKGGMYLLAENWSVGQNPLAPFGENAARHLRRYDGFRNAPDILINGAYDATTGEVGAFEEKVGSHGGLGGGQSEPFLIYPRALDVGSTPIVGCETLHRVLKGWIHSANGQHQDG